MTPAMVDLNTVILSLIALIGIVSPFILAHLTTKAAKEAADRATASLVETQALRTELREFLRTRSVIPAVPVEIVSMPESKQS